MAFLAPLKSLTSCLKPSRAKSTQRSQDTAHLHQTHDNDDLPATKTLDPSATDYLPPLRPVTLPKIIPYHQPALAEQGWSTITYAEPCENDSLYCASHALLQASKEFFALPSEEKQVYRTQQGSEEGWSRVEGEKEMITLRSSDNTPEVLKNAAETYWAVAAGLLNGILGRVAESLGLPAEKLTMYSEPCTELRSERTATMLRLFRYEGFEGRELRTVAEAHRDLGLLSLVIGDTPGLEVWDRNAQMWFQIERSYTKPAGSLLVGRQLEQLSNGRYRSGGHLVRSYPDVPDAISPTPTQRNYRYSLVLVLRAHSPVPVNTDDLTTSITGEFQEPIKGITADELFRKIQGAHFNINTGMQERDEQRRKLAEKKSSTNQSSLPKETSEKES